MLGPVSLRFVTRFLAAALFLFTSSLAGATGRTFEPRVDYATGYGPEGIAVADFNGDGKLDVVTVNTDSTVSVFLGRGDGTFPAFTAFPTGSGPYAITVGDFNNDGKLDIATASNDYGLVSVLLGNGDGTFQAPIIDSDVGTPWGICTADFNLDGKPDLAVVDFESNNMYVLLGNGDGTFQAKQAYSTGGFPQKVVSADFNSDGKPDLAVAQGGALSIFLGNGDGTFQARADYSPNASVYGLTTGDFNGDGILDVAVVGFGSKIAFSIYIFIGQGDGTFDRAKFYKGSFPAGDVVAADFQDDPARPTRALDLAVLSSGVKQITLLEGLGSGYFVGLEKDATGGFPRTMAVGDFNGDDAPDIVVCNATDNTFSLLLNRRGSFMTDVSSSNPSKHGKPVAFTATVTMSIAKAFEPSGSVSFYDGTTLLGSATIANGQASFTTSSLAVGQHTIGAHYSGDDSYNQNDAVPITQVVTP